jgi:hypothetical protein
VALQIALQFIPRSQALADVELAHGLLPDGIPTTAR